MSQIYWKGGAASVPQVDTLTVGGTVEVGDKFKVTLTDEDGVTAQTLSVSATSTSTATTATDVATAFNASTLSLLTGITAAPVASTVVLTADIAGVPFYCTVATTESDNSASDGQTFARASTTPNSGPMDWNTAANWSTGAVPVAADDVTLDARGGAYWIRYGLNQSGVTLASLSMYMGAPQVGDATYALKISATAAASLNSVDGGTQSGRFCNINTGTNVVTWNIDTTGSTGLSGLPPLVLAGSHASNVLNVYGGTVGVGLAAPGQSCNFPTINVRGGSLITGGGTDFTTAGNNGGKMTLGKSASAGTVNSFAGTTTINGATKTGTLNAAGGQVFFNARLAGDDIGVLVMDGGTIDALGNAAAFSATSRTLKRGGVTKLFSATQFSITTPANNVEDYSQPVNLLVQIGR